MKTIQYAGLMAILGCILVCLTGCPPNEEIEMNAIPVTGEINSNDYAFYVNERNQASLSYSFINGNGMINGNGRTLNLTGRHTHTTFADTPDYVQFESGNFQYDLENGDMIFGFYSGCGTYCVENVCCDLNFQITGGTGKYANAKGYLTAVLVKNQSLGSPGLVLNLTGTINTPITPAVK